MSELLASAEQTLLGEIRPAACRIDQDPEELRRALGILCNRGWMALKRPVAYGGPAVSEDEFRGFQELAARASGSLAFLQTQHQSAVNLLAKSENEELKQRTLPKMHDGGLLVGIGFSQLRRPGPPVTRAAPVPGGFRIDGHVPWATGWTFFDQLLIGASLPDGEAVFGLVPFSAQPCLRFSAPMKLAAMETAQTVTCDLDSWLLKEEDVLFVRPQGWIAMNDTINITLQGFFALGCAAAGLDVIEEAYQRRERPFLLEAHQALGSELSECREAMKNRDAPTQERLRVRAWGIELAARCAHAAVTASAGAANSLDHHAQRIYRESLVYTVSAQTEPIMEATLARLARRGSYNGA